MTTYDKLTFYRTPLRRQWRWRYTARGNTEKLANGGESYLKLTDAMEAAFRVCGIIDTTADASSAQVVVDRLGQPKVLVNIVL